MKRAVAIVMMVSLGGFGLSACFGDEPESVGSAVSTGGRGEVPPATPTRSPTDSIARASVAGDVCDFLAAEAPRLESVGSGVGAVVRFAGDYGTWVGEDPSHKLTDAAQLDTLSTQACPQLRARALKALGGASFADVLS